jgi:hypothetical protein
MLWSQFTAENWRFLTNVTIQFLPKNSSILNKKRHVLPTFLRRNIFKILTSVPCQRVRGSYIGIKKVLESQSSATPNEI